MGILTTILGLLPLVTNTVSAIETMFGAGNGPVKKQAVVAAVGDGLNIYANLKGRPVGTGDVSAAIGELVDAVVKLNNALGIFQQSPQVAQAAR
jgi:hypothetical protein